MWVALSQLLYDFILLFQLLCPLVRGRKEGVESWKTGGDDLKW
jgi:hypothetical protein